MHVSKEDLVIGLKVAHDIFAVTILIYLLGSFLIIGSWMVGFSLGKGDRLITPFIANLRHARGTRWKYCRHLLMKLFCDFLDYIDPSEL